MKNTENTAKTPAKPAVKRKSPVNKKASPEPVKAEEQKAPALGLETPIWLRNTEGRVFFGLKVDQAICDENDIRTSGWVIGALDKIELRINGESINATLSKGARPDVAQALGINEPAAGLGFQLIGIPPFVNLPGAKLTLYWSVGTESGEIVLREKCLDGSGGDSQKISPAEVRYHFDKVDGPCLHGWLVVGKRSAQNIAIKANGRIIECEVIRRNRKDAAAALGVEAVDLGFQLIIPGYLWEEIPADENPLVQFLADGLPLANVTFTRKSVAEWIENVVETAHDRRKAELLDRKKQVDNNDTVELFENSEEQYLVLLALEHLRYGNLSTLLTSGTLRVMQKFAAKMNLANFVSLGQEKTGARQPANSFAQLLHWKALRLLNERLSTADSSSAVFTTVAEVMHELDLSGDVKELYLCSVVPMLCRHDVFFRLRELADLTHWHHYEHIDNAPRLTITLAALTADRIIPQAINALWKLSHHLNNGWVNFECIYFSVKELNRQVLADEVEGDQIEKFAYANIGLLDAFRGERFSRLHDRDLIQTAVALLDVFDCHTDYCRRDIIKALIRNYGLVPEFWQILADAHPDFHDAELDCAYTHWQILRDVLESPRALYDQLDRLLQPLNYFRAQGNPETSIFLREVLMNTLPLLSDSLPPAGRQLIEMLFKDAPEGSRLAAFPLANPENLQAHFPETSTRLLQIVRELTQRPKSTHYQAQSEAGQIILQALQADADNDHQALADKLKAMRRYATILNTWHSQFLSLDIQVLAYELGRKVGLAKDSELYSIVGRMRKVVAETKQDSQLPAPLQAALARLNRQTDDTMIRALIADMQQLIQQKFDDTFDFLFEPPKQPALTAGGTGFPNDTLVVIYSCRKYLDTRIAAIRNTWVQDLIARNIPYLVLVGDGDDSIDGDILALDVSDKYEDLPKKTLKLFDWVVENTAFHYVYKIDDDCYLDVSRFFDTLTYRKHPYYGRIIERGVGSMDRAWHQSKSQTLHAQKVLDKSPEPSIYADGGGGYVLSRFAMLKLRQALQTEAGQHLIAVSLMEDKLVGDLLSISGIYPNNEDYESYQRRRTFAEAVPVGMWDNLFFPSLNTPTVMTHLDTERDMQGVHERRSVSELWPKKVWPTCRPPLIKERLMQGEMLQTNQLELLNTPERLNELLNSPVTVVAVVRNEMIMLPHFLAHYRQLGVQCFLMVDNLSDDGTREYLLEQPDVGLFSAETEYQRSHYGVAWQQALLSNFCLNKWVLLADADELLVYPNCETVALAEFIESIEREEGVDCIRTDMIDMYPFADLDDADLTVESPFAVAKWFDTSPFIEWRLSCGHFSNTSSLLSSLRHRIISSSEPNTFTAQKYGLLRYKPWMRLSQGIHGAAGVKVAAQRAWFAHFKYHAGFKLKVETEILRGQHFDDAKEYRRYAEILAESKGGFGDQSLSVCYESSADLSHWRISKSN